VRTEAIVDSFRVFLQLAMTTGEFLIHFWPVSAALLVFGLAALAWRDSRHPAPLREHRGALASTYLIPLAVLLVGTLLRYELHGPPHPHWRKPPEWYGYLLWTPPVFHLTLVPWLVVRFRGDRERAAGILLPGLWFSLCAVLPAGFAIAGVGP